LKDIHISTVEGGKAKSDEISRVNAWLVLGVFDGPYSGDH